MFRTVPPSITRSFSLCTQQWYMSYRFAESCRGGSGWNSLILLDSRQQTCMTYTIAVCTVKNSWWWTEDLSETCSFISRINWEISAFGWFSYKKSKQFLRESLRVLSISIIYHAFYKYHCNSFDITWVAGLSDTEHSILKGTESVNTGRSASSLGKVLPKPLFQYHDHQEKLSLLVLTGASNMRI
jgi:hypothetical protein